MGRTEKRRRIMRKVLNGNPHVIKKLEKEIYKILKERCEEEGIECPYKEIHVGFKDGFRYIQGFRYIEALGEYGWHTITKTPVVMEEENAYGLY